nr:hypothetical protein Iba_scaffold52485CG0020 [Ipomoea batatas]GME20002.1 hypothetical protein Iba_scaffold24319CG0020 [Ipomoea batatas]
MDGVVQHGEQVRYCSFPLKFSPLFWIFAVPDFFPTISRSQTSLPPSLPPATSEICK